MKGDPCVQWYIIKGRNLVILIPKCQVLKRLIKVNFPRSHIIYRSAPKPMKPVQKGVPKQYHYTITPLRSQKFNFKRIWNTETGQILVQTVQEAA